MSEVSTVNNKRIAKNTLLLYIRMIFTMAVTLYTSRVVLKVLGAEDFGIYSVVGGVVTMFSFINGGMVAATQRYITFEIGRKNKVRLQRVFSTSLQIHFLISVFVLILAETIGLWFLLNKMTIPEEKLFSAFWVYQCSIIASIVNIMSIPYNADIIAHEKMSAFAYISVVEVSLKLGIVYLLLLSTYDKLLVYAVLVLIVQLCIRLIYSWYCKKHFAESKYQHHIDFSLLKEMFSFAAWSFWGGLASVLYTHGVNILLNVFFGPIVNAARGIAVQVQSAVQQFVSNFQMALNPQITKNFATGNLEEMHSLMFRSARFSFFLLYFLTLPILLEANFILSLWLDEVPPNTQIFTQLMILISLIYATANPLVVANQATGKVKVYQAVVGGVLLLILPISYITLKLGAPAYAVFIVHFFVECVAQIVRMMILRKYIKLNIFIYVKNIYIPIFFVIAISVILPLFIHHAMDEGWERFVLVALGSFVSVGLSVVAVGLTKNERRFILGKVTYLLNNNK